MESIGASSRSVGSNKNAKFKPTLTNGLGENMESKSYIFDPTIGTWNYQIGSTAYRVHFSPIARLAPRWTSENRPYVDTSKPANGAEPEQEYLYPAGGCSCKHFFDKRQRWTYTDLTWAEDMATQGCDLSADSTAGMRGRRKPPFWQHSGAKAVNPRGLGTESPSKKRFRYRVDTEPH